jgi:hypothetical protein
MGGWLQLLAPLAIVCALIVVGFVVFNNEASHIAEDL